MTTAILNDLQDSKWTIREKATIALRERTEGEEVILYSLIKAASDRHPSVREATIRV